MDTSQLPPLFIVGQVMMTEVLAIAASPLVQSVVKGLIELVTSSLSTNAPLVESETEKPKLTTSDRRVSIGLTKRDDKITVVLLVEKSDTSAQRKAETLATQSGDLLVPLVTGVAHSSKVEDPIVRMFQRDLGTSIGHIRGNPGSLGCFVKIKQRGELRFTGAAHVLSMLNRAEKGDPILLPGHPDGPNRLHNRVGTLEDFTYLNHWADRENWANLHNREDIALVKVDEPNKWPDTNLALVPSESNRRKKLDGCVTKEEIIQYIGEPVYKYGRSSELTSGILEVIAIEQYAIRLPDGRVYMYSDLLGIKGHGNKPFSMPGDSGALVYTKDFRALGFVVGGSDTFTFACSAERCLSSMDAELI